STPKLLLHPFDIATRFNNTNTLLAMGCRNCRGWEESECCLSQQCDCACACHTSCDCSYCYTVELKARSTARTTQAQTSAAKSTATRISNVLRLDLRPSVAPDSLSAGQTQLTDTKDAKSIKSRRWSRRNSTLKPLRLFA
ncbi:hypothetical protein GGI04_003767, partial [Coemansia thaxteri]